MVTLDTEYMTVFPLKMLAELVTARKEKATAEMTKCDLMLQLLIFGMNVISKLVTLYTDLSHLLINFF